MRTCYVSMPFGVKTDMSSGETLDFDMIYRALIKPAAEAAGLNVTRADELSGANVHLASLRALLSADVFLADITAGNPDVAYDLGVRHATRRGATILIGSTHSHVPFSFSYLRRFGYDPRLLEDEELKTETRRRFEEYLVSVLRRAGDDSPLYDFFPSLVVELPEDLSPDLPGDEYPSELRRKISSSQPSDLAAVEDELERTDAEPLAVLDLMRRYLSEGEWDGVVSLAESLDDPLRSDPDVILRLAQALIRRNAEGDYARAISILDDELSRHGPDPNVLSLLGLAHKRQFRETGSTASRDAAIDVYVQAMQIDSNDLYSAISALALLAETDRSAEYESLAAESWASFENQVGPTAGDYWSLMTGVELAVHARRWERARELADLALRERTEDWMIDSSLENLASLSRSRAFSDAGEPFDDLLEGLRNASGRRA